LIAEVLRLVNDSFVDFLLLSVYNFAIIKHGRTFTRGPVIFPHF